MKRRIKIISVSSIIFLVTELFIVINVQAEKINQINNKQILVVDKIGNGDYLTIQNAVDNAQPGSTIYIKKGEYNEIIEIKKQIKLIGEEKSSTLINPTSEKNKYAIHLGAPGVKIQSLGIKNGAPGLYTTGIKITSSKIEISDCNIYDTPVGIAIWTSENKIDNCDFWGCNDEGIALLGTRYSECNNNKITNCIFKNNCDGIEQQFSSCNIIMNCQFYNNWHAGIDAIVSSNDKNTISNCRIYNNAYGIYLSSSSNNQIKDCFISNNEDGNIIMNKNSENNQIITNSFSKIEDYKTNDKELLNNLIYPESNSKIITILSSLKFLFSF